MINGHTIIIEHKWGSWPDLLHGRRNELIWKNIRGRAIVGRMTEGYCEYHFEYEDDAIMFKMKFV